MIHLPTLNAGLNATSAVLIGVGWLLIRKKKIALHKACMVAAVATSALFLVSYLYYHANFGSTKFTGTGMIRTVYFSILLTHTVLAAVILPMVIVTLRYAWTNRLDRHARLARWTFPLWMYVSVTGVVIYAMLY